MTHGDISGNGDVDLGRPYPEINGLVKFTSVGSRARHCEAGSLAGAVVVTAQFSPRPLPLKVITRAVITRERAGDTHYSLLICMHCRRLTNTADLCTIYSAD